MKVKELVWALLGENQEAEVTIYDTDTENIWSPDTVSPLGDGTEVQIS